MALADGRLFHVNVNCSELDRSRRFYVDGLGLTEGVRTAADHAQPGTAFGLDRARWDAWILLGPRAASKACAIDLLEWQEPAPQGAPPGGLPDLWVPAARRDRARPRRRAQCACASSAARRGANRSPMRSPAAVRSASSWRTTPMEPRSSSIEGDGPQRRVRRGGLRRSRSLDRVLPSARLSRRGPLSQHQRRRRAPAHARAGRHGRGAPARADEE